MNLKGSSSSDLTRTKAELDAFLGDKACLGKVRKFLKDESLDPPSKRVLQCFERTFSCYIIEEKSALELKELVGRLEAELAESRNKMELGYVMPDGNTFVKASSVQLRNKMRTDDSEDVRKACFEGLRSIGPFVSEKVIETLQFPMVLTFLDSILYQFCEIVKLRNQFARSLGFECFYDMKVSQAEGFNKSTLFTILDDLERRTRPTLEKALVTLASDKGAASLQPYNTGYYLSGDINKLKVKCCG